MPNFFLISSGTDVWVINDGIFTNVFVDPNDSAINIVFNDLQKFYVSFKPPFILNDTIDPYAHIYFLAISCYLCDYKPGYITSVTFLCYYKKSATTEELKQLFSNLNFNVFALLINKYA